MAATYSGPRPYLSIDDERGITYLYPAGALGSLSGYVRSSNLPIVGARVTIANLPNGTATTDSTGHYNIGSIPIVGAEPYTVTVSADNYQGVSENISITGNSAWDFNLLESNGGGNLGGNNGGGCKKAGPKACP